MSLIEEVPQPEEDTEGVRLGELEVEYVAHSEADTEGVKEVDTLALAL